LRKARLCWEWRIRRWGSWEIFRKKTKHPDGGRKPLEENGLWVERVGEKSGLSVAAGVLGEDLEIGRVELWLRFESRRDPPP